MGERVGEWIGLFWGEIESNREVVTWASVLNVGSSAMKVL